MKKPRLREYVQPDVVLGQAGDADWRRLEVGFRLGALQHSGRRAFSDGGPAR